MTSITSFHSARAQVVDVGAEQAPHHMAELVVIDFLAGAPDASVGAGPALQLRAFGIERAVAALGEARRARIFLHVGADVVAVLRERVLLGPDGELVRLDARLARLQEAVIDVGEEAVMRELGMDLVQELAQLVAVDALVELRHHLHQVARELGRHRHFDRGSGKLRDPDIFLPALALQPQFVGFAVAHGRGPIGAHDLRLTGPKGRIRVDEPPHIFPHGHGRSPSLRPQYMRAAPTGSDLFFTGAWC